MDNECCNEEPKKDKNFKLTVIFSSSFFFLLSSSSSFEFFLSFCLPFFLSVDLFLSYFSFFTASWIVTQGQS